MPDGSLARVAVISGRDLVRVGLETVILSLRETLPLTVVPGWSQDVDLTVCDVNGLSEADLSRLVHATAHSSTPVVALTAAPADVDFGWWPQPPAAVFTLSTPTAQITDLLEVALSRQKTTPRSGLDFVSQQSAALGLTRREVEVLALIAQGDTNSDICEHLFLGINTVKTYIRTAYRKINATSRTQALLWALQNGFPSAAPEADLR